MIAVDTALFSPGSSPVKDAWDEDMFEEKGWKNGEAVILYLPPMVVQDGTLVSGQTVKLISPEGAVREMPFSGIIADEINQDRFADAEQNFWSIVFANPYTVIVSGAFLRKNL
ncbi:hypothetical protein [uncultured Faecalibaculum sp.]|uniref:hypothetical protein n=2 Tax=uncultured Faecalibaculum sp. TaxID=1729681 RepID=UPI00267581A8|nr:hypothetical protein [uncultured Faecalibaculum sp.]